jgi:hypothetical protein
MIAAMRDFLAGDPAPMRPAIAFEWTDMWDIAIHAIQTRGAGVGAPGGRTEEDWALDELRLDDVAFEAVRQRALLRHLARQGYRRGSNELDAAAARAAEQQLRTRLGLFRKADVERWCAENGLDPAEFARLTEHEARLAAIEASINVGLGRDLLDELRLDGTYGRYLARARDKRSVLAARGQEDPTPVDCGLTPIVLVAWHFETRAARPIPDDLNAYARRLGLARLEDFYRMLAREWLYFHRG